MSLSAMFPNLHQPFSGYVGMRATQNVTAAGLITSDQALAAVAGKACSVRFAAIPFGRTCGDVGEVKFGECRGARCGGDDSRVQSGRYGCTGSKRSGERGSALQRGRGADFRE